MTIFTGNVHKKTFTLRGVSLPPLRLLLTCDASCKINSTPEQVIQLFEGIIQHLKR
jgi:hypothetical protein